MCPYYMCTRLLDGAQYVCACIPSSFAYIVARGMIAAAVSCSVSVSAPMKTKMLSSVISTPSREPAERSYWK